MIINNESYSNVSNSNVGKTPKSIKFTNKIKRKDITMLLFILLVVGTIGIVVFVNKVKEVTDKGESGLYGLILPKEINNYVLINGGTFQMGSPEGEVGRGDYETQHQVKVNSFYMSKYEVTIGEFKTFVKETTYKTDAKLDGVNVQYPVVNVSWEDANEYCKWLSKKTNKKVRLPMEAEWEYACRAKTTKPFNTGENLTTEQANYNGNYPYRDYPKDNYVGSVTVVGSYKPNDWGLYDMHGNVWEWCSDWYSEKYYDECEAKGIVENPTGPPVGSDRVLRGGSWYSYVRYCRSAVRTYDFPGYNDYGGVGFRPVFLP